MVAGDKTPFTIPAASGTYHMTAAGQTTLQTLHGTAVLAAPTVPFQHSVSNHGVILPGLV